MEKIQVEPGIYRNTSFEDYISWDCFHKSMVGPALRSTLHLDHYIKSDHESTKAMDFGSLVDCMILEPDIFGSSFKEKPETYTNAKGEDKPWNMNSNFCKAWMADVRERNITPYTKSDYSRALSIIGNIENHDIARGLLNDSKYQTAFVWRDSETGILCKGRIDIEQSDSLCDLKITANASPNEFRRTLNNFLYHVQGAMYTEGWASVTGGELLPWSFIVAESEEPHAVAVYNLGDDSLAIGKSMFQRAIRKYKKYLEFGPTGYSPIAEEIDVPQWAVQLEDSIELDESLLGDTK